MLLGTLTLMQIEIKSKAIVFRVEYSHRYRGSKCGKFHTIEQFKGVFLSFVRVLAMRLIRHKLVLRVGSEG